MGENSSSVAATEVQVAAAVAGLLLVFFPFFVGRYAARRDVDGRPLSKRTTQRRRRLIWLVPAATLLPTLAATTGLLTLLGRYDLSTWTHVLTLASIWAVLSLVSLAAWLEGAS
jgi:hypothetical protein